MKRRTPIAAALAELTPLLPRPWSGPEFVARVANKRKRPIALVEAELGYDSLNGIWLELPDVDIIGVPTGASGDRLATIICHEIAHMVLKHEPENEMSRDELARILAPDLDPGVVARFMGRHGYEPQPERDAETLATRLLAEIRTLDNRPAITSTFGRLADHLL